MANRFWVGGSGNWSDGTNHWSTSSGGGAGASVPGTSDIAIMDALSNTTAYTITLTTSPSCAGYTFGPPTLGNLTIVGDAVKTISLTIGASGITVTGTPNVGGNSPINRLFVVSNTIGTPRTITSTGATVAWTNTDFRDITSSPAIDLSAQTDIGGGTLSGCSGITFPAYQNCFWVHDNSASSRNWSDLTGAVGTYWMTTSGGSTKTRVPLMQDTAVFDANSFPNTGSTVVQDMPRIGSVTFVGVGAGAVTNVPTLFNNTSSSIYGSLVFTSSMTFSWIGNTPFMGRGSYVIDLAGKSFGGGTWMDAPNGTYTLLSAYSGINWAVNHGTFNADTFNVTIQYLDMSSASASTLNLGSGTWTLTGTTAAYQGGTYTLMAGNSTVRITNVGAVSLTLGSKTYNNLWYSPGSGTSGLTITGTNTFTGHIKDDGSAAHSITMPNVTTTVGDFQRGAGTNVITLQRTGAIGTFTLTKTGGGFINQGLGLDYMSISNMVANPDLTWYVGPLAHSTDGGGNTGVYFSQSPLVIDEEQTIQRGVTRGIMRGLV